MPQTCELNWTVGWNSLDIHHGGSFWVRGSRIKMQEHRLWSAFWYCFLLIFHRWFQSKWTLFKLFVLAHEWPMTIHGLQNEEKPVKYQQQLQKVSLCLSGFYINHMHVVFQHTLPSPVGEAVQIEIRPNAAFHNTNSSKLLCLRNTPQDSGHSESAAVAVISKSNKRRRGFFHPPISEQISSKSAPIIKRL